MRSGPKDEDLFDILFSTNFSQELILHWGAFKQANSKDWVHPDKNYYPDNTKEFDKFALQTTFVKNQDSNNSQIHMVLPFKDPSGEEKKNLYGGIKYVFYRPGNNRWYNNSNMDYMLKFFKKRKPRENQNPNSPPDYLEDIINCEVNYSQWTLAQRYNKCYDIIQIISSSFSNDDLQWVLIWLRYSYMKLLDWQRNKNTPPRELSGALSRLTYELSHRFIESYKTESQYTSLHDSTTPIIRNIISLLGKGTGNGQAIRDDILRIMHKHNLPRKGKYFYEEWHQKLHNNSTPEDIIICEALLAFLRSNNIEDYRRVLREGGITKERLLSYERNITTEPEHNYAYIGDFEIFLNILKSVHSNNDLIMMYNSAKYVIGDKCYVFDDIVNNKNSPDVLGLIGKVTYGRNILDGIIGGVVGCGDSGKMRDLIFLDIALEDFLRQLIEKIIHINFSYEEYIREITYILENLKVTYKNYIEVNMIYEDWINIVTKGETDLRKTSSVANRIMRLLSSVTDYYNEFIEPKAKYFGNECNIDESHVNIFAEELIRGTIFFGLSVLIRKVEKAMRDKDSTFSKEKYLIISRCEKQELMAQVIHVKNLSDVQFEKYQENTILIANEVKGDEEVPNGVNGIIIVNEGNNYPDVLAHVSVRARNMGVLLTICFDEEAKKSLCSLDKNFARFKINGNNITFDIVDKNDFQEYASKKDTNENTFQHDEIIKELCRDKPYDKIVIDINDYSPEYVGEKSMNTMKLFNKVPNIQWLKYPQSFSLPFSTFDKFLALDENKKVFCSLQENLGILEELEDKTKIISILDKLKGLINEIQFPDNSPVTEELNNALKSFGIPASELKLAYASIKSVWSSKYNQRVYLSMRKQKISLGVVKLSVLVQKIIPAEYAFVIHTKNPLNNNNEELFAEIVNGMGESLVGAYGGSSFSFVIKKDSREYEIKSYQNKSVKLVNDGFIFRSDSNIEDIKFFAGAGLFDSIPMKKDKEIPMKYFDDKLFRNKEFVDEMINHICDIGMNVEKMFSYPQDIEGVYYNKEYYIVQTRPQV